MAPLLLIFGTSHVGKSTLAQRLGDALGWPVASTDKMGRHPGRPWPQIPPAVAEHYSRLSDEAIYWFLRVHQDNIWPHVSARIAEAALRDTGAAFEGSALRPDLIVTLPHPGIVAVGLHADDAFLSDRIRAASAYAQADTAQRLLVDKFITRSLRQNADFRETGTRLGITMIDASRPDDVDACARQLIAELGRQA